MKSSSAQSNRTRVVLIIPHGRSPHPAAGVTGTHLTTGYQNELMVLDQILREKADTKALELAEATYEAEYLAWRDKFVG